MKYLYLMILSALFMPQILYSDNIWTLDNKEYHHAFFVKATEHGLVFKHQGKQIIFKPEELKPASRQMYTEEIKAYEKIVRTKSRKAQRKFNADLNAIEEPDLIKRLQELAELKKFYTSQKFATVKLNFTKWEKMVLATFGEYEKNIMQNESNLIKRLQTLAELKKLYTSPMFATVKLDFQKWEKMVQSTFEEYEKNIMQMSILEAVLAFRKQQNQFPKLDLITEKVTALAVKLNGMLKKSFSLEVAKLKTEPIDARISHGEKMLEVYKDIVSDFTELNSVIAEAKKELPVWTALKNSKSSKKHAKEIANLEKLISTYPKHPQTAELQKLKEFHKYNQQVDNDIKFLSSLYPRLMENPEKIIAVAEKAVKAYADSIYAADTQKLLDKFQNKLKEEKRIQAENERRRKEAEAERQRAEANDRKIREWTEISNEYKRETGYYICGHCLGTGWYRAHRGGDPCPTCDETGTTTVQWAFERPSWYYSSRLVKR
ncbi:MAG: hypothetical protein IJC27_00735 [Lentisphaeria bacterium]|nr:hypothetical protein [Lentisphaeria bacterium]